jgi:hypothetical protein
LDFVGFRGGLVSAAVQRFGYIRVACCTGVLFLFLSSSRNLLFVSSYCLPRIINGISLSSSSRVRSSPSPRRRDRYHLSSPPVSCSSFLTPVPSCPVLPSGTLSPSPLALLRHYSMHDAGFTPFATHPGVCATARMHVRLSPSCRSIQATHHIGIPEQGSLVGVLLRAASCNPILVFNAHSPTTCSSTTLCLVRLHLAAVSDLFFPLRSDYPASGCITVSGNTSFPTAALEV